MKHFRTLPLVCGAAFFLSGCGDDALYAPSAMLENERIQVEEQVFSESAALSEADERYIQALAHHYMRYGGGSPVELAVTYDPASRVNSAMAAGMASGDLAQALRVHGVRDVQTSILPVNGQGDQARMLVRYMAYSAHAPQECEKMMPGMNDGDAVRDDREYKMGCSISSLIARQVSRPSDLLGRGNVQATSDGRAATNVVEAYRTGAPNEPLDGESASEAN